MADFIVEPSFDPPERFTLAWHLNGSWQYDPDPRHASEVEVRFIAEGPNQTRIELEHRGFARHSTDADAVRRTVDSPQGWDYCLARAARFFR